MVCIRLRRTGRSRRPSYRVVVANSQAPRDGRFLEIVGHYNPLTQPPTVVINRERVAAWVSKGARPSNTVKRLMARTRVAAEAAAAAAGAVEAK